MGSLDLSPADLEFARLQASPHHLQPSHAATVIGIGIAQAAVRNAVLLGHGAETAIRTARLIAGEVRTIAAAGLSDTCAGAAERACREALAIIPAGGHA